MDTLLSIIKTKAYSYVSLLLLASFGGVLWTASGIILTMAPAGNPPFSFRNPAVDVRLHLALGLFLISVSLGILMLAFNRAENRNLTKACFVTILAGAIHLLGRTVRDLFLQRVGWEPLLPLGFLLCISGLFMVGLVSYRSKAAPSLISFLFMLIAAFLLFFNDQYLPLMAVPFGLGVIALSGLLGGFILKLKSENQ